MFGTMGMIGENPLYGEVKEYLGENSIAELNGVAIVRSDFMKPVSVYNESCDQEICFKRSELAQLGFNLIL